MIPTISDVLGDGESVRVDLLREVPESTDPQTWLTVQWPHYASHFAIPELTVRENGALLGRIVDDWELSVEQWQQVQAVGITRDGACVLICLFSAGSGIGLFRVEFLIQPWVGTP